MVILNLGRKEEQGVRLGKYELGKTLGEGNFGKVKLARDTHSGKLFAVKILDKSKIIDLNNIDQVWFNYFLNYCFSFFFNVVLEWAFTNWEFSNLGFVPIHGKSSMRSMNRILLNRLAQKKTEN